MYNKFKNIHLSKGGFLLLATIGDRIKFLRTSAKLNQEEFGKQFGLVKSTVSLYENGKSTPDDETKIKICEKYNVSMDWLYGLTSISTMSIGNHENFVFDFSFADRLNSLLKERKISKEIFQKKTGVSDEQMESLMDGRPNIKELIAVADFFHVSIDYLICRTSIKSLSDVDSKFLSAFQNLDEDNQDIIIGKTKELLKEQRHVYSVAADSYKQAK